MTVFLIDTTQHRDVPPDAVVGGLTLYERATRFAARAGATRAIVVGQANALPSIAVPRLELEVVESLNDPSLATLRSDVIYTLQDGEPVATHTIATAEDAARAENDLWEGCRKPVDGIVSRHLNRHISLAISRRIAATAIRPNHVTAVTFSLGVLSGVAAAIGGSVAWVIAGVLFQTTSVLDGVDGELARVRMDGSVLGEWLDTISDDSSDLFMYAGLGVGAWRVEYLSELIPPALWLALGLGAALGKLTSMVIYYRWLHARGRGDLLAFEWSFDRGEPTLRNRVLGALRYVTKNDFIAFAVMVLGLVGVLPWFLFVALIGTWVVAAAAFRES